MQRSHRLYNGNKRCVSGRTLRFGCSGMRKSATLGDPPIPAYFLFGVSSQSSSSSSSSEVLEVSGGIYGQYHEAQTYHSH